MSAAAPAMKPAGVPAPEYAGIGARFLAVLIDGLLLGVGISVIVGLAVLALTVVGGRETAGVLTGLAFPVIFLASVAVPWYYEAWFLSSPKQATLGKQLMGVVVTDVNGGRISFGKATARYLMKAFVSGIFFIGYIVAFFTEKKQALHDIVASTIVVKGKK